MQGPGRLCALHGPGGNVLCGEALLCPVGRANGLQPTGQRRGAAGPGLAGQDRVRTSGRIFNKEIIKIYVGGSGSANDLRSSSCRIQIRIRVSLMWETNFIRKYNKQTMQQKNSCSKMGGAGAVLGSEEILVWIRATGESTGNGL